MQFQGGFQKNYFKVGCGAENDRVKQFVHHM